MLFIFSSFRSYNVPFISSNVDKKVATYERTKNGILLMDIRAINTENRIRKVIGEPKRTMYGTQKVPKELLE